MLKKKYPNLCLECLALQKVTLSIVREILGGPRDEKEATKGAAALGTVLDLYMTAWGFLKILPMKKKSVKKVKIASYFSIYWRITSYKNQALGEL